MKFDECVGLVGSSGAGKSTLMRMVWGNYLAAAGSVIVAGVYVTRAAPRDVIALQRGQMSYVSQFRRVLPRVLVLDVVSEPMLLQGVAEAAALDRARALLARLNIPQALCVWSLTTFSGGEQQRVHIARGFIRAVPVPWLDEPTASLNAVNREVVLRLIAEAKARGAAILGIFHDEAALGRVCDRLIDVTAFAPAVA